MSKRHVPKDQGAVRMLASQMKACAVLQVFDAPTLHQRQHTRRGEGQNAVEPAIHRQRAADTPRSDSRLGPTTALRGGTKGHLAAQHQITTSACTPVAVVPVANTRRTTTGKRV